MGRRFKIYKSIILAIIMFGGLGWGVKYFLYDYTSQIMGELLFQIAKTQEKDNYNFKNTDISYYPFERQIRIEGLTIFPTNSNDSLKTTYQLEIPELFLDIKSLREVYFDKKLTIIGVTFSTPTIDVYAVKGNKQPEDRAVQFEARTLYQKISRYLRELKIQSFDLVNGSIRFFQEGTESLNLDNFTLGISEFSMDTLNLQEHQNIFYTETVTFQVGRQTFRLENSGYQASFDSLMFSSGDSVFQLKNFVMFHPEAYDREDSINVKSLSMKGIDLNVVYEEKTLDLGMVLLEKPYVHIKANNSRNRRKNTFSNNSRYLIKLDSIKVEDGSVSILSRKTEIKAENIVVERGGYQISPNGNYIEPSQFMEAMNLRCSDVTATLETASFESDSLIIDGFNKDLQFYSLVAAGTASGMAFNYRSPFSRVKHFNLSGSNFLSLDSLWLLEPTINLMQENVEKDSIPKKAVLTGLSLNNIIIQNGDISYESNPLKISATSLNLNGNQLADTLALTNLRNLALEAENLDIELPKQEVKVGQWSFNGKSNQLTVRDVSTKLGDIKLANLYGLDQERLASNRTIMFDSLNLNGGNVTIEIGEPDSTSSFDPGNIEFDKIGIKNFDLEVYNSDFITYVQDLNLDILSGFKLSNLQSRDIATSVDETLIYANGMRFIQAENTVSIFDTHFEIPETGKVDSKEVLVTFLKEDLILTEEQSVTGTIKKITLIEPVIEASLKGGNENKGEPLTIPPVNIVNGRSSVTIGQDSTLQTIDISNINLSAFENINLGDPSTLLSIESNLRGVNFKNNRVALTLDGVNYRDKRLLLQGAKAELENLDITLLRGEVESQNILSTLRNEPIEIDDLYLAGMQINIDQRDPNAASAFTNTIKIKKGKLNNISTRVLGEDFTLSTTGMNGQFENLSSDPKSEINEILTSLSIELSGDTVEYLDQQIQRNFQMGKYSFNKQEGKLILNNLKSESLLSKDEFMQKQEVENDWMAVSVGKVLINGLKTNQLIQTNDINIGSISIVDPEFYAYRDKLLPDKTAYQSMIQTEVRKAPFEINIDSAQVIRGKILVELKFPEGKDLARIHFPEINGKLKYIYQNQNKVSQHPNMLLSSTGKFMRTAEFEAKVVFNNRDTLGNFEMNGKVRNGNLPYLNNILENAGHLRINSGTSKLVDFEFKANNDYAVGEMKFYYDDLNVTILNEENEDKGFGPGIKTFFANTFVINNKNPRFFLRKGDIFFERNKTKQIFDYWSNAILSGVVSSIGARNNKKEIREINNRLKKQLQQDEQ